MFLRRATSILSLNVKQNSTLQNHIQQERPTAKYRSSKIQNEILDIAASQILNALVADCRKAKCYVFIANKSTDVGVKEQISLCAPFVDKKEDGKPYIPEDFLTFVHADNGTTADALVTQFLDALNKIGVPVSSMIDVELYSALRQSKMAANKSSRKSDIIALPTLS